MPGRGWGVFHAADGTEVAVINAQGRTYMRPDREPVHRCSTRCSTSGADELPKVRIVDFHCELTSEKNAFGIHLDGRVSAVCGTHTHVATADERILPRGTGYISDIGMTGPVYSVIGFDPATVLPRFINALPTRFEVGAGPVLFNAIQIDIDPATGRALAIERMQPGGRTYDRPRRCIEPLRRAANRCPAWPANTVDLHSHTDRSDGVLSPRSALRGDGGIGHRDRRASAITTRLRGYRRAARMRSRAGSAGRGSSPLSRSTASPTAS